MNKDVKKYQEALKYARRGFAFYEKWTIEYFDLLQELVDKATPMKVLNVKKGNASYYGNCPICNNKVSEIMDFCITDGQALEWSEDNER